jgi:hypothetical protein
MKVEKTRRSLIMRKMFINFFVTGMIAFTLCACGKSEHTANNAPDASSTEEVTIAEVVEETTTESAAVITVPETIDLAIGTTGYIITIPSDYYGAEVTEKERKDDMIAYYKSDERLLDFDIYQYPRDGRSLKEYTALESEEYGADDFETLNINDTELTLYYSEEKYDGKSYRVANYLFEAGDDFGEIAFWLDGENAEGLADLIISSLKEESEMTKIFTEEYMQEFKSLLNEAIQNTDTTLVKKDSSEDVNEIEGGLFITKNGVECRSVKISSQSYFFTFGEELYNETGEDKTFDPTKFLIETESGEVVYPCLISNDLNEISTEAVRLWTSYTIYDPKDLKEGSEASVYYDGVFITKVMVD